MARNQNRKKISNQPRLLKKLLRFTGIIFVIFAATASAFLLFSLRDLPRPEKFTEGIISQSTKIYDRTGQTLLYEIAGAEKRTYVTLDKFPDNLKNAVLTAEDRTFYQHQGIDPSSIIRAIIYDLKLGQPAQGGSTISQQLIRNYFLSRNKTIKRKTQEIILTVLSERQYSKNQIFEWYLNIVPFGSNLYGAEAASQTFFKKPAAELSLAQSAILTAMIKSPSYFWPYGNNTQDLFNRKDYILNEMAKEKIITQEQADTAKNEALSFNKEGLNPIKAPHFVMFIKDYLEKTYGANFLQRSGLKVTTTLDINMQEKAEKIISEQMEALKYTKGNNAALVAINPKNGDLLAMVGSKDYFASSTPAGCAPGVNCKFDPQTNVATSARQPGSSFKPIVYAKAFWLGYSPSTILWDTPTEFNPNCSATASQTKDPLGNDCYNPGNYDGKFKGLISLREALAQSRNMPAVKTLYLVGVSEALSMAKTLGITTLTDKSRFGLALVLGGGEVKPLELTAAYAVFANDGIKNSINFISKIENANGNILDTSHKESQRVLPAQVSRQINDVLSDNDARAPMFGYNSSLYLPGYNAAAKTGTTQNNKDAWCVGYTPNLAVGVWVGNNDNSPMTNSGGVSSAGPIWKRFMLDVLPQLPIENFIKPEILTTGKPMIDGLAETESHTILYYINKNDPAGDGNSQNDTQFPHWEYGVQSWLQQNQTPTQ